MEHIHNLPPYQRVNGIITNYSVARSTVWYYAKKGLLTPIKVSPKVTVFKTAELEDLFNGKAL